MDVETFRAKVLVILSEAVDHPLSIGHAARRITELYAGIVASETREVPAEIRARLADVYDPEGVQIWLTSRNRFFDMRRPIDVLQTPEGEAEVRRIVGMLADGNF